MQLVGDNSNHWLGLKLIGENGPASDIAARIIVTIGDKKRVYINQWSTSYLSNNDPRVHIGLGQNKHIDRIEIFWSDGRKETYYNPPVDCYLIIEEGKGIKGITQAFVGEVFGISQGRVSQILKEKAPSLRTHHQIS